MMGLQKKKPLSRTSSEAEHRVMLKSMLFASIISADNDEFTEDVKQEVLTRHKKASKGFKSILDSNIDWEYVLEPLNNIKLVEIMKAE